MIREKHELKVEGDSKEKGQCGPVIGIIIVYISYIEITYNVPSILFRRVAFWPAS